MNSKGCILLDTLGLLLDVDDIPNRDGAVYVLAVDIPS